MTYLNTFYTLLMMQFPISYFMSKSDQIPDSGLSAQDSMDIATADLTPEQKAELQGKLQFHNDPRAAELAKRNILAQQGIGEKLPPNEFEELTQLIMANLRTKFSSLDRKSES